MINIRLYDIFRKDLRIPDEKAQELVEVLDTAVKAGHEENLKGLATNEFVRGEIREVKGEINGLKGEIREVREFVKSEINRVELKVEQTKSELTRFIYLTSLIQVLAIVGAIIGIISFIFRK